MDIAPAALAGAGRDQRVARLEQVLDHELLLGIDHGRSGGNVDPQVTPPSPVAIGSLTWHPFGGPPHPPVRELGQAVDALAGGDDDAASAAAIAAVGTSFGDILFPAEAGATITAPPGDQFDFDAVNKHGVRPSPFWRSLVFQRVDIDAATFTVEADGAGDEGEQRVVVPLAHIPTGVELGANLTHEDAPRFDRFAAKAFDATPLRIAVASVPAGALPFLMSHCSDSSKRGGDYTSAAGADGMVEPRVKRKITGTSICNQAASPTHIAPARTAALANRCRRGCQSGPDPRFPRGYRRGGRN